MTISTILQFFRSYFLTLTKVLTLISALFFITQYKQYEIKFGFMRYWLPTSFITSMDNILWYGGTILLLIPCTIIVLSFLLNDNPALKVASGFIGVFGVLFNVIRGVYNDTLGEFSNFEFFLIATLEQKREWFKFEVKRYATEICINTQEKLDYINNHLLDHDFITYDGKLTLLKTLEKVKLYAITVVADLSTEFEKLPVSRTWLTAIKELAVNTATSKWFWGTLVFLGGCYGLYKLIDNFANMGNDGVKPFIQEQAVIGQETVVAAAATQGSLDSVAQATANLTQQLLTVTPILGPTNLATNLVTEKLIKELNEKIEQGVTVSKALTDNIVLLKDKVNDILYALIKLHPDTQESFEALLFNTKDDSSML